MASPRVSGDRALTPSRSLRGRVCRRSRPRTLAKPSSHCPKGGKQCERKRSLAEACASLSLEMSVRIAQAYEKQDQLVEAMSEFEKALRIDAGKGAGPGCAARPRLVRRGCGLPS